MVISAIGEVNENLPDILCLDFTSICLTIDEAQIPGTSEEHRYPVKVNSFYYCFKHSRH